MNGNLPGQAKKCGTGKIADSADDEECDGDFAARFARTWHVAFDNQRKNQERTEKSATDHPRKWYAYRQCSAGDHRGVQIEIAACFDERGECESERENERDA